MPEAKRPRLPFFAPLLAVLSAVHLLDGNLEDIRIWNRVLTGTEIASLISTGPQ